MLKSLRHAADLKRQAANWYAKLVRAARNQTLFAELGVSDTMDGRFDALAMHAWLVLSWLRQSHRDDLAQSLIDVIFSGFDESLREQGIGDMGMGRRMTKFADAFYGRLKAYEAANDNASLAEAILRNVYRGDAGKERFAEELARYCIANKQSLSDLVDAGKSWDFIGIDQIAAIHAS